MSYSPTSIAAWSVPALTGDARIIATAPKTGNGYPVVPAAESSQRDGYSF